MIHYLRQEEKNRSRKLWEEIFTEDSQSFVDFMLPVWQPLRRGGIRGI